jgi:amidase
MIELRTIQDFADFASQSDWGPTLISDLAHRQETDGLAALLFLANSDQPFARSGALGGLPILIKDNIDTMDLPTTAGSFALSLEPPRRDAAVVARLRAAGATIIGKANLSEWANFRGFASISGWSARGGIARNPHDPTRSSGGSSSGSAAAVAAGYVPVAIGTETDGSVLCPGAMNGVVGFKSTPGAIDRTGVIPLSHSQDSVGIFANRVSDARTVATHLVDGPHQALRPRYVIVESLLEGLNPKTLALFEVTITAMQAQGIEITRVPTVDKGSLQPDEEAELIVLAHELGDDLDRYLKDRNDAISRSLADIVAFNAAHVDQELTLFGQELLAMSLERTWDLATYEKARDTNRETARLGIDAALRAGDADIVLAPTMNAAWLIDTVNGDPDIQGNWAVAAVAGYPSLTLPIGKLDDLPIGMTMISRAHTDLALLAEAETVQRTLAMA